MSININDINIIIDCIKKESINFLKNDMQLDIKETKSTSKFISSDHFATIELIGKITLMINLDIEEKLFDVLFNKFFKDGVSCNEKDELVKALPDEIINIIAGLAIRHFPEEYRKLLLGVPLDLEKKQILEILDMNISQSCKITTSEGSLLYTIIQRS